MFKIISVTQSEICGDRFLEQLDLVCQSGVDRVILREKHLGEHEYEKLAIEAKRICDLHKVHYSLHNHLEIAKNLGVLDVHLTYDTFINKHEKLVCFNKIGVSVHSVEQAIEAEKWGADYIIAGHIFQTDCKKDIPPRCIEFLSEVCDSVLIPVHAIGGIAPENIASVKQAGASGACLMSSLMKSSEPEKLVANLRANV